MFIENMIVQCASFGTDEDCKLILRFFFSKNLPSYACSMALAQAIHDDTIRSGIEFEPAPWGSSRDIDLYIPRVLLATTYDTEYISHRPVLKVAMRPLIEGRDDVKTFALAHFGPAKAPLAALALDIILPIFTDENFTSHIEAKERTASDLLTVLAGELPVNSEMQDMAASLKSPLPYVGLYDRPACVPAVFGIGTGMILQPPTQQNLRVGPDITDSQPTATASSAVSLDSKAQLTFAHTADERPVAHFDCDDGSIVPVYVTQQEEAWHDIQDPQPVCTASSVTTLDESAQSELEGTPREGMAAHGVQAEAFPSERPLQTFHDLSQVERYSIVCSGCERTDHVLVELNSLIPAIRGSTGADTATQGVNMCPDCGRARSAQNTNCEQCLTVVKLSGMHTPHGGTQVTGLERARLDEPFEYIQEPQDPTVVLTPEQMAELEARLQNDRASPVMESGNTDPRVATVQTAGLAHKIWLNTSPAWRSRWDP